MVRSPVVSSIRSKHTGHVGSSSRDGVGGGAGLAEIAVAVAKEPAVGGTSAGENGSLSMFPGKFAGGFELRSLDEIN